MRDADNVEGRLRLAELQEQQQPEEEERIVVYVYDEFRWASKTGCSSKNRSRFVPLLSGCHGFVGLFFVATFSTMSNTCPSDNQKNTMTIRIYW